MVEDWPDGSVKLGSVSAVTFDVDGNVVVFHRVDRLWEADTFDIATNIYREQSKGPITGYTVLALDKNTGKVVYKWGRNLFYMPHGLTIDHENNAWVTDVALHQVMKFGPKGSDDKPMMVLGTKFLPGQGSRFCKPTSVAVLENGDFFVADGYCNARIVKFNKNGEQILQWGQHSFMGSAFKTAPKNYFAIPHALTLVKDRNVICAADRENGRIQCFTAMNGTFVGQYHNQVIGDRLFSMAYSPANNGQFFVVNGPAPNTQVAGYVVDYKTKDVLSRFGANNYEFSNPHDIAVTDDASAVYVVELSPYRVYKFVKKTDVRKEGVLPVKPTATSVDDKDLPSSKSARSERKKGSFAALVVILVALFGVLTLAMTLLISRRRRRGNENKDKSSQGIEYNKLVAGDDDFE